MNPLKKIYCRTFQTGLKIALPFLPYRKPKIVGSVKALPEVIQKKKCSKVLIITDAGIRKLTSGKSAYRCRDSLLYL